MNKCKDGRKPDLALLGLNPGCQWVQNVTMLSAPNRKHGPAMLIDLMGGAARAAYGSTRKSHMRRRHLYVDVSIIARHDAGTGIQRVVRAIWLALRGNYSDDFDIVAIAGSGKGRYRAIHGDFLDRPLRRLPFPLGKARLSPQEGDVFLGLDLSTKVAPRNHIQLRRWRARGVKLAFVVYDLLPVLHPDWFTDKTVVHYRNWLKLITQEADLLACISHTVNHDLKHWIEDHKIQSRAHIATIRLGTLLPPSLPKQDLPAEAAETIAWARAGTCVMMVGTIEPRKGHQQVLEAFEELWQSPEPDEDYRLLIVGRPGWKTEAVQHNLRYSPHCGDRLRWIDSASDDYLENLYHACWGVLMASHGEGFGLPLLEASARGKPVLARDLPIFREVGPTGTAYFDDDSAAGLAAAIRQWRDCGTTTQWKSDDISWIKTAGDLTILFRGNP